MEVLGDNTLTPALSGVRERKQGVLILGSCWLLAEVPRVSHTGSSLVFFLLCTRPVHTIVPKAWASGMR